MVTRVGGSAHAYPVAVTVPAPHTGTTVDATPTAGPAPSSRPTTDPATGLDAAAVAERVRKGLTNEVPAAPSRTVPEILRANIFTRFNLLMSVLLAIVLACQAYKDALFGGVVVGNALVGIVQELRAKRTLDALAVLSAPKALVVRDGEVRTMSVDEIVLDDIIELQPGHQVVADAVVSTTSNLEVDESLLTGESDPVVKSVGDEIMSGSFVVAGTGRAQVDKVGADAYAVRLAEEARRFTLSRSELMANVNKIVTWVAWALIPTGAVLLWSALRNDHASLRESLVTTVGGVVAMVPEGLILLTTVAFAVGVVRLARRRTLVQELPAIEILARVDVVCLDKTGTITSGDMDVAEIRDLPDGPDEQTSRAALAAIAWSDPHPNATQLALQGAFDAAPDDWVVDGTVSFSSARKWSATSFQGHGSWVVGAPEMVMSEAQYRDLAEEIGAEAANGRRVLAVAHADEPLAGEQLPSGLEPAALVMIEDQIRPDAPDTLDYFARQDVTLKVISGDNPITVGAVAARAGLHDADNVLDARTLPTDPEPLANAVAATTVFGRVSPHQKRSMVHALQARDHVVAMTGDGVNDVLALKDADVGIAMASGSEATRAVAQLVLLDSNFSGLPQVVAEGRKVINNLQRVASLFLTKTTWAILIALVAGVSGIPYPFLPRHLTLVGTFTIGVPAFFLALAPNADRVRGNFFGRVARVAVPSGVVAATATLVAYVWARTRPELSEAQTQTTAALVLTGVGMLVLIRTSRPFVMWKGLLVGAMCAAVLAAIVTGPGRRYFELDLPPSLGIWVAVGLVSLAAWLLVLVEVVLRRVLGPA